MHVIDDLRCDEFLVMLITCTDLLTDPQSISPDFAYFNANTSNACSNLVAVEALSSCLKK